MMDDNAYRAPEASLHGERSVRDRFGSFQMEKALSAGWSCYTEAIGLGVAFFLVWLILIMVAIVSLVGWIVLPHLSAGILMFGLSVARRQATFSSMFVAFNAFGRVFLAALILFLIGFVIVFVLYIPAILDVAAKAGGVDAILRGDEHVLKQLSNPLLWNSPYLSLTYLGTPVQLYLNGRFLIVFPLIIERDYGALEALKTSWRATASGHLFLLLFMFLVMLISYVGIILCLVGILFTIPLGLAFYGVAMRQLLGEEVETAEAS